jgi:hypothetical protein
MTAWKKSGAKLTRTETVTVRLDPKLRYLAELASRKQRRTLSSFIEWVIEESLKRENIRNGNSYEEAMTFFDAASFLWDVNEVDRLLQLAKKFPDLLNHDEQVLWKLLHEASAYNSEYKYFIQFYNRQDKELDIGLIRACWKELNGVINGSLSEETLKKAMLDHGLPF